MNPEANPHWRMKSFDDGSQAMLGHTAAGANLPYEITDYLIY